MEKENIFAALRSLGVTEVYLSYTGYGDEGMLDSPDFTPKESVVPWNVSEALRDFMYTTLCDHYAGWEINEGSNGEIFITLSNDEVNIKIINNMVITTYETDHIILTF